MNVISLRTASEPAGVVVAFSDGAADFLFHLPRKIVEELLAAINQANDRARWYDVAMALIPNDGSKLQ
jgi:hypothetical protein